MTRRIPALALALLALAGCGGGAGGEAEAGVSYTVRGRNLATLYDGAALSVDSEAIPGLRDAMTMDYRLADAALVAGLAPETPIRFRLEDRGDGLVVTSVEPLPPDTPLDLAD